MGQMKEGAYSFGEMQSDRDLPFTVEPGCA